MIFAIPSYKRVNSQETLLFLQKMKIPSNDIYIFLQTEEDYSLYREKYSHACNIVFRPANAISIARNNILEYFKCKEDILMLDDDISCFSIGAKDEKFQNIEKSEQFTEIIEKCFCLTKKMKGYIFGFYPVHNEYFMSNDISTKVTVNTVLGFPKGFDLHFNETFKAKEDIELCGRILNNGGNIIRFNNISFKAKHRTNKGGAYEAWHSNINYKLSRMLSLMYPKIFAVKKNNPQEVRVCLKDKKVGGIKWKQ